MKMKPSFFWKEYSTNDFTVLRFSYLESQVAQLSRTTPSAQYETEIRDQVLSF